MTKVSSKKAKNSLVKFLEDFGLSENEARVYSASLSLGTSTIQKIAFQADLKRTTVYSIIESLRQKGLMNIVIDGLKKKYTSEDPERLEILLEERKRKLKEFMPGLSALFNMKESSSVIKYYEGLNAIKQVYEIMLKGMRPKDNYMVIANQDKWLSLDEEYFRDFTARRAKMDINIRMLFTEGEKANEWKRYERNYNCKVKILPKDVAFSVDIVITPQKMVIQPLSAPIIAIVIENENVVKMQQEIFEMLWKSTTN